MEDRLRSLMEGAVRGAEEHGVPLVFSVHPRTRARLEEFGLSVQDEPIRPYEPFGFFDFVALERHARCVLTDSGTVQEECCIMGVPTVTVREVTERPETVECGSNVLSGVQPEGILRSLEVILDTSRRWQPPPEYLVDDVSATVASILL